MEQALEAWETICFLRQMKFETDLLDLPASDQARLREVMYQGPEKHWRTFREYLLQFRGSDFDVHRYLDLSGWGGEGSEAYGLIAPMLAAWTAYSRRVLRLTPQLQVELELTSISNLRWADILWPYDAFLIGLGRPIEFESGRTYDYLLVSTRAYGWMDAGHRPPDLMIMLLPENLAEFPFLTEKKRRRIERLIRSGRRNSYNAEAAAYNRKYLEFKRHMPIGEVRFHPNERIVDVLDQFHEVEEAEERTIAELDLALRLAVGLAMHLTTVPPSTSLMRNESPYPPADPDIRAISRGARICTVLSTYTMDVQERKAIEVDGVPRQFRQLSPHWRRGYFRREWGQGRNPTARRTVRILPVLVRKDLLGPKQQVGGSDTTIPLGAASRLSQFHRRRVRQ